MRASIQGLICPRCGVWMECPTKSECIECRDPWEKEVEKAIEREWKERKAKSKLNMEGIMIAFACLVTAIVAVLYLVVLHDYRGRL